MAADYRFLLANVKTDAIIAELPVEAVVYSEVLNSPGALNATIRLGFSKPTEIPDDPADPGVDQGTAQSPAPDVEPGKHAIYVERNGALIWGGVIWTYVADVASNTGQIGAEGFFSLLRNRILYTYRNFEGEDQVEIAHELIEEINTHTDGDTLIASAGTLSGVTRDRTYHIDDRKDIGEAIEQLAAVDDGFDFRVGVRWDDSANAPVREFLTTYPATGRSTNFILELGRNLELLTLTVDATTLVKRVNAVGDGISTSISPVADDYLRRDETIVISDVTVPATLEDHAQRRYDRGQEPMRIPRVAIYPDQDPALGTFIVGDIVTVRGTYGAVDFGGTYRITTWTASVDATGNERVELDLAPTGVFS